MKPIIKIFFKGLIAIIPIIFTLYLLLHFTDIIELVLEDIFTFIFPESWYIKGLGFLLALPLIFFFGGFLESRTFRSLFDYFEELVLQIPVIKSVYAAIREFSSLFSSKNRLKFKQVVLVNVPPGNSQQIGFITVSDFDEVLHTIISDNQVVVYLPSSYSIGGITVIMSRENITEIDMSVEDALRFIATAGVLRNVSDNKNNC